jgi:hypothetical protein
MVEILHNIPQLSDSPRMDLATHCFLLVRTLSICDQQLNVRAWESTFLYVGHRSVLRPSSTELVQAASGFKTGLRPNDWAADLPSPYVAGRVVEWSADKKHRIRTEVAPKMAGRPDWRLTSALITNVFGRMQKKTRQSKDGYSVYM